MSGDLSRLINRLTGGYAGQTLCARLALAWGHDCKFCKLIAAALREPDHCRTEAEHWQSKNGD